MKSYRYFLILLLVLVSGCEAYTKPSHHRQEEYTALFANAEKGNLEAVQQAIESDPTLLNKPEWENSTLLHTTVRKKHLELSAYLIKKGIDVNAVTTDGVTPLHYAARNSHIDMIKLLIQSGAKVNATDKEGRTPLDWGRIWGTPEAVELLRQHGGRAGLPEQ